MLIGIVVFGKENISIGIGQKCHIGCITSRHCISDQFDVILMDKTRTFLSDPKLLNGSVGVRREEAEK
jgi:hypothetical protein